MKKIEKNNATIALNVLHAKKEKIYLVSISKNNSDREKKFIPLMIREANIYEHEVNIHVREANSKGRWYYLALKNYQYIKRNNF